MKPVELVNEKRKSVIQSISSNGFQFSAGWGKIFPDSEQVSDVLMAVNISVIPMKICNGTISYNGQIPVGSLCAGYMDGGKDSCQVKCFEEMLKIAQIH